MEFLQNFYHLRRGLWKDYADAIHPFYEQHNCGGVLIWEQYSDRPFKVVWWKTYGLVQQADHTEPNGQLVEIRPMDETEALWWISQDGSARNSDAAEAAYEKIAAFIRGILPARNCFPEYVLSASGSKGFVLLQLPCWKRKALLATKNSFVFVSNVSSEIKFRYGKFISPECVSEIFAKELSLLREDKEGVARTLTILGFPREVSELDQPIDPSCLIAS